MNTGIRATIVLAVITLIVGTVALVSTATGQNSQRKQEYVSACIANGNLKAFCECAYTKLNKDMGGKGDINEHIDTLSESALGGIIRVCQEA